MPRHESMLQQPRCARCGHRRASSLWGHSHALISYAFKATIFGSQIFFINKYGQKLIKINTSESTRGSWYGVRFLVWRSSGYLAARRVPLKCSQQQKGLFFHPKQMEILAGGQKQILFRGWSVSDSPRKLWDPGDSQPSAVSICPRGAPMEHGKTEGCLGAGRVREKELRVCREWFLEPGEPGSHFCCPHLSRFLPSWSVSLPVSRTGQ